MFCKYTYITKPDPVIFAFITCILIAAARDVRSLDYFLKLAFITLTSICSSSLVVMGCLFHLGIVASCTERTKHSAFAAPGNSLAGALINTDTDGPADILSILSCFLSRQGISIFPS